MISSKLAYLTQLRAHLSASEELRPTASEFRVLVMLMTHADADGTNAFPSVATLARESALSDRQTARALANLQSKGWIRQTRKGGPGGRSGAGQNNGRPSVWELVSPVTSVRAKPTQAPFSPVTHDRANGFSGDIAERLALTRATDSPDTHGIQLGPYQVQTRGAGQAASSGRCPKHANHPNPPNCFQCKEARQEATHQAERLAAEEVRKLRAERGQCLRCDDNGKFWDQERDVVINCDHRTAS